MFNFVSQIREENLVTQEDISIIEEKWNFKFPPILVEYYLKYNGSKISLCVFTVDNNEYEISEIVQIKHGICPFEFIIKNDREDGFIPLSFIPVANNRGGDYYYWDEKDGKVYLIYTDDIENPIFICDSVEKLFEIMESCI